MQWLPPLVMYGTKTKYRRRFARKGRVARVAKGRTTKVQALAKAVSRIQRRMRTQCEYLNYRVTDNPTISADYTPVSLCNYNSYVDIFGTSSNDDEANKMIHKSFGIDMYLTLENTVNEPDTTQFTIFLVSLKDNIGGSFNATTGALSLSANVHYSVSGGMAMLNKKMFNIHKVKRVTLSNHGQALSNPSAQNQYGTDCRLYWKWRPNKLITNPAGDWKSLQCSPDPSKQYYLLVFNDNSAVDLQNPRFIYNVVHTIQTVA